MNTLNIITTIIITSNARYGLSHSIHHVTLKPSIDYNLQLQFEIFHHQKISQKLLKISLN